MVKFWNSAKFKEDMDRIGADITEYLASLTFALDAGTDSEELTHN